MRLMGSFASEVDVGVAGRVCTTALDKEGLARSRSTRRSRERGPVLNLFPFCLSNASL